MARKVFAGGYWKRSYPEKKPVGYSSEVKIPEPLESIHDDMTYWIARCLAAEDKVEKLEKQLTAAETRIAELKLDRELIMQMRPVSRSVLFKEEF